MKPDLSFETFRYFTKDEIHQYGEKFKDCAVVGFVNTSFSLDPDSSKHVYLAIWNDNTV